MLKARRIVICISGGIAVYKVCELVRLFKKSGCEVRVAMTKNAEEFVAPLTFETLSGMRVYDDSFAHAWEIEHISLAKFADLCIVAPATANLLAKIRSGIADDLVSTAILAMPAPVLIAPAMNSVMWKNPATQENVSVLKQRGYRFIGPASGSLACGDSDIGRMSEPEEIYEAAKQILCPQNDLEQRKILVTAGPTREMLDPVRFLTNRSTGRMGYAIAEAARDRGAEVTLVTGPVDIEAPSGINVVKIVSTQDLFESVTKLAQANDAVIQAAAPADFTPSEASNEKIKKSGDGMVLKLKNTPDIAQTIGKTKRPDQVFVAFAAETNANTAQADAKRRRKNADIIVLNDVTKPGAGFAGDTNIVTIITDEGAQEYPLMSKRQAADIILDAVTSKLSCATQK
ncbi:MAG: bifunctional phosphopantothenoylcysteine decarboxylase/phosphopantothenate--cysteine ligase CoaBC [Clostridia bacterium]|nr:bifunctional phosphopantothenoylcysteine decarboxylase/phosphopantothenate--cysteine ligase CoaBC [Clostridia bacterium]